jgi:D-lactate dehydrogenase
VQRKCWKIKTDLKEEKEITMAAGSVPPVDVFFYEAFQEEEIELKALLGDLCTSGFSSLTIQELGHEQPPARLISIRTQSAIPLEWSTLLNGVLSRSTGYDHLLAYRSKIKGHLPLGYLDEYATRAVAEQAILLALALLRKLPQQMEQFKKFERDGLTGAECPGRNLLVVGVGRIGSEIYRIARALGFAVKGVDIVPDKLDVEYVARDEGIAWCDVIVSAMNLTDQNRGYFTYDLMKRAKPGTVFVNIARGEHSPINELNRLLEERRLGGVGLDVYDNEGVLGAALRGAGSSNPASVESLQRLASYPNVILTPHNAFNTVEAVRRKSQMSVEQIQHFLKHRDFIWKLS